MEATGEARFRRKNLRLAWRSYSGARAYFVTACCHRRQSIFRNGDAVDLALRTLAEAAQTHEFVIHAYCFMPDHAHVLTEGAAGSDLLKFMHGFKQHSGFAYRRKFGLPLWQPKYYDHVLRRSDAIHDVAWYIWMNPVRKGLASAPREYSFSGSYTIEWREQAAMDRMWLPPWKAELPPRVL